VVEEKYIKQEKSKRNKREKKKRLRKLEEIILMGDGISKSQTLRGGGHRNGKPTKGQEALLGNQRCYGQDTVITL